MAKQNVHQGPKQTYKARPPMLLPPGVAARFAALAKEGKADETMANKKTGKPEAWIFTKKIADGGFVAGSTKEICIISLDPPQGHQT
jgi:hypothetical protein